MNYRPTVLVLAIPKVIEKLVNRQILKFGNKVVPMNYRPTVLVLAIPKVIEKLVNRKIFRNHRSIGDLLVYVTYIWTEAIEKYDESGDILKSFNRMWHKNPLSKLYSYS